MQSCRCSHAIRQAARIVPDTGADAHSSVHLMVTVYCVQDWAQTFAPSAVPCATCLFCMVVLHGGLHCMRVLQLTMVMHCAQDVAQGFAEAADNSAACGEERHLERELLVTCSHCRHPAAGDGAVRSR